LLADTSPRANCLQATQRTSLKTADAGSATLAFRQSVEGLPIWWVARAHHLSPANKTRQPHARERERVAWPRGAHCECTDGLGRSGMHAAHPRRHRALGSAAQSSPLGPLLSPSLTLLCGDCAPPRAKTPPCRSNASPTIVFCSLYVLILLYMLPPPAASRRSPRFAPASRERGRQPRPRGDTERDPATTASGCRFGANS
jgi:hypothetical protein